MNRFFWGNFDFEEQLRGEVNRPARLERLVLELAACWLAVADAADRIWCPGQLPAEFLDSLQQWNLPRTIFISDATQIPPGLEFVPWGWSPAAVEFATRHSLTVHGPSIDVVRLANSREYSTSLEGPTADGSPFATLCRTVDEVLACIESRPADAQWVIKANWSHAARERILGRGRQLSTSDTSWIKQRLARDGIVSWEKWLQRESEIGIQWHITPSQSPQLIAITELLVDPRGQYAGTRALGETDTLPDWVLPAAEATRPAVEDLARQGYFGPVGIDAMRYFDPVSNSSQTRPLQDINARWTMGRLAAGWFEKMERPATWRHGTGEAQEGDEPDSKRIATSPERINGSPVSHRTWLSSSLVLPHDHSTR